MSTHRPECLAKEGVPERKYKERLSVQELGAMHVAFMRAQIDSDYRAAENAYLVARAANRAADRAAEDELEQWKRRRDRFDMCLLAAIILVSAIGWLWVSVIR